MSFNTTSLISSIRECSACSFRDQVLTPVAPAIIDVPVNIMFVGENPSWAEDQIEPFASNTISGYALEKYYLQPLGLTRSKVWITDLFKCRYPKDIYRSKSLNEHLIQANAETCIGTWLTQEILLAQPRIIVTLSNQQVYQRLRIAFSLSTPKAFDSAVGKPHQVSIGYWEGLLFPMIHPDISRPVDGHDRRKEAARLKWAPLHSNTHIPSLRSLLAS